MAVYRIQQPYNDLDFRIRLSSEESAKLVDWLDDNNFFNGTTTIVKEDDEDIIEL